MIKGIDSLSENAKLIYSRLESLNSDFRKISGSRGEIQEKDMDYAAKVLNEVEATLIHNLDILKSVPKLERYFICTTAEGLSIDLIRAMSHNQVDDRGYALKYSGAEGSNRLYEDVRVTSGILKGSPWERKERSGLETTSVSAIIGLVGGSFFLSSNVTGNVIGLSNTTSSWVGGVLILVGLIALGFWVKNRKNKKVVVSRVVKRKKK